jgi:pilus assembly protein Flp/PilA
MKAALSEVKRFVLAEDGLETVEYAIISGIIVVAVIATLVSIGTWVSGKFTTLNAGLAGH